MSTMYLPAPRKRAPNPTAAPPSVGNVSALSEAQEKHEKQEKQVPSYEERALEAAALRAARGGRGRGGGRKPSFVPRSLAAFGDGGAFPEIHVAQYPRNMGNPNRKKTGAGAGNKQQQRAIVNVEVDASGKTSYDSIVRGGTNSDKKVYTSLRDMKASRNNLEVDMPTNEEEEAAAEKTRMALQLITDSKVAKAKPASAAAVSAATASTRAEDAEFVKYAPDPNAPGFNPNTKERVIKIISAQVDPMEPPKHKHKKTPGGPAEDPVPILHSPPKKLTVEDQQNWKIPPCISNWKNSKGYTIPLDKRLAADGRGIRENTINNNFATLSESLYIAERQAREEVRMRANVQKRLALDAKERRENNLRELAAQARAERSGAGPQGGISDRYEEDVVDAGQGDEQQQQQQQERQPPQSTDEDVAAKQREKLRQQRRKEREREMRLDNLKGAKKQKIESERDISEKIALGMHTGTGAGGGVDSRLYNQSGGLDSGFGPDDAYSNAYSKPLFERQDASQSIYRPSRGEESVDQDEEYNKLKDGAERRFKPDKGFAGTDTGGERVRRDGPVQFEQGK